MPERWVRIAREGEVAPGSSLALRVERWDLALHNVDGRLYCTSNVCPHQGLALAGGPLAGTVLTCPWHGWKFDVTTGFTPYSSWTRILCFPLKIEGGEIFVGL